MPVPPDVIDRLRSFNRYYARRAGLLDAAYLGRERPAGQANMLFEVGDGVGVRELRERLGLDAGYVSRTLGSLEEQGLLELSAHPDDARARVARPTPAGRRELATLDDRASAVMEGWLGGLVPAQVAELDDAVTRLVRLLRVADLTVAVAERADAADAQRCLETYADEIDERFPEGYARDEELLDARTVIEGGGGVVLAREHGTPIAVAIWTPMEAGVAEFRHVWVRPSARRLGVMHRVMALLERDAAAAGVGRARLYTHRTLVEAHEMFRTRGYREIPGYSESPYSDAAFEKDLESA